MNAKKGFRFVFIFFIILPLGLASCGLQGIASLPQRSTQAVAELSQTLAAQEASWRASEANAQSTLASVESAMGTSVAQAQATTAAQASLLNAADQAFANSTQAASDKATEVADLRHLSATQYLQIEDYNNTIRCSDRPDSIDFTNNATVSASLKSWLENTSGNIDNADWEVIWEGTEASLHRLSGQYYYVYMVYFDEPDNYFYASVYDVYMHCFIYP